MQSRTRFVIAAGIVVSAIVGLIIWSLTGTGATAYYKTPGELSAAPINPGTRVRVAGKVVAGSVEQLGETTNFTVTDGKGEIAVTTKDVLPDTFGTGVEVVAEGTVTEPGLFTASTVLAKCPSKFKARVASGG
ncbi:MAG: cytochrome c maturation protein CcmE [Actinomycetota bacterium]